MNILKILQLLQKILLLKSKDKNNYNKKCDIIIYIIGQKIIFGPIISFIIYFLQKYIHYSVNKLLKNFNKKTDVFYYFFSTLF